MSQEIKLHPEGRWPAVATYKQSAFQCYSHIYVITRVENMNVTWESTGICIDWWIQTFAFIKMSCFTSISSCFSPLWVAQHLSMTFDPVMSSTRSRRRRMRIQVVRYRYMHHEGVDIEVPEHTQPQLQEEYHHDCYDIPVLIYVCICCLWSSWSQLIM